MRGRMRAMQASACQPGGEGRGGRGGAADSGFLCRDRCLLPAHWGSAQGFFPKKEMGVSLFASNSCCQNAHSSASATHYYSQRAFVVSQHFSASLHCHVVWPNSNCRFFFFQLFIFSTEAFSCRTREMNCFA